MGSVTGGDDESDARSDELKRYEIFIEALPDPVFATDRKGYLSYVNRAFTDRFGYEAGPESDVHVAEFLTDDAVDRIVAELREMVSNDAGQDRRTIELRGLTRGGRTRTFEASVSTLPGDSAFAGTTAVLRDVTARKRRDEVFEVMDRALRHNLRTNVTLITGHAELLESAVGPEHETTIETIHDASEWILKLGTALRTVEEAFGEHGADERVTIDHLVESSVESARSAGDGADVTVHASVTGHLRAGRPLEYALENVVENAIVHNDTESPTVEIWVAHADRDGWLEIHVADDGPGIPAFERDVVLGEVAIDELQHGSGLGLWLTRWIVDAVGGTLEIADNDPRGTIVTFRLPLVDGSGA